jgi:hypothetical protein
MLPLPLALDIEMEKPNDPGPAATLLLPDAEKSPLAVQEMAQPAGGSLSLLPLTETVPPPPGATVMPLQPTLAHAGAVETPKTVTDARNMASAAAASMSPGAGRRLTLEILNVSPDRLCGGL